MNRVRKAVGARVGEQERRGEHGQRSSGRVRVWHI